MLKNKIKESKKRMYHEFKAGDQVLIVKSKDERIKDWKLKQPTEGPCAISKVHRHSTVTILRESHEEIINIRLLKTFKVKNAKRKNKNNRNKIIKKSEKIF